MKDLTISIAILLIFSVLFSVYGTPPEQDTETHGEVAMEQGENSEILQGNGGDQMQAEYYEKSPETGDWHCWF